MIRMVSDLVTFFEKRRYEFRIFFDPFARNRELPSRHVFSELQEKRGSFGSGHHQRSSNCILPLHASADDRKEEASEREEKGPPNHSKTKAASGAKIHSGRQKNRIRAQAKAVVPATTAGAAFLPPFVLPVIEPLTPRVDRYGPAHGASPSSCTLPEGRTRKSSSSVLQHAPLCGSWPFRGPASVTSKMQAPEGSFRDGSVSPAGPFHTSWCADRSSPRRKRKRRHSQGGCCSRSFRSSCCRPHPAHQA